MTPEFFAAEAAEARNRQRAYLARQLPLELPVRQSELRPRRMMLFPLVTLTWRHCLELAECGNAFFTDNLAPFRGDFLELLWRLHPYHRDAEGHFTNVPAGRRHPSRLASCLSLALLQFYCWRLDIQLGNLIVRRRIREAFQDEPSFASANSGGETFVSLAAPKLSRLDDITEFLSARGWTIDEILAAGVACSIQIERTALIAKGHGVHCIAPSAALLSKKPEPSA